MDLDWDPNMMTQKAYYADEYEADIKGSGHNVVQTVNHTGTPSQLRRPSKLLHVLQHTALRRQIGLMMWLGPFREIACCIIQVYMECGMGYHEEGDIAMRRVGPNLQHFIAQLPGR